MEIQAVSVFFVQGLQGELLTFLLLIPALGSNWSIYSHGWLNSAHWPPTGEVL